jgi:hypothetical protein
VVQVRRQVHRSRPLAAVVLVAAGLVGAAAPATGGGGPSRFGAGGTYAEATRMDAAAWTARQDGYLAEATSGPLDRTRPESLIAFAERARRDPGFDGDIGAATAADFDAVLGDDFDDDFTMSTLLTLWTQDHDLLSPSLAAAIKAKVLGWKYWWTEKPIRENPGKNYYWTENHQIIFLADEYLAGQAFPDEVFPGSGMTGREHMAHARTWIQRWVELRSRYGFSEFLSVPYTAMTFEGVVSLADLAEDPELADLLSKVADVMLVEVASHLQDYALGSAKGRTYTGNLFNLRGGGTPVLAELVFGSGTPRTNGSVTGLAVAHRYRPPEVAHRIAASQDVGVVRQHQSLPLDPTAPVTDDPVPPDQLTFQGEYGLVVWWAMGAQLAWQVAPLSVDTIETYNLWKTPNFQIAGADVLENVVKGKSPHDLRVLAQGLGSWLNPGLLSAVDTYTWRSPDAMLSTAQDWRAGQRTESALVSQATLDGATSVFTNHPKGAVGAGGTWSGDGAAPRAAQHDDTAIVVYAPQYEAGGTSGPSGYQGFTHAFFPQDRFDEVVRQDGWTFGRKGDGYVALWSWRPTAWVPFDASVEHPDGITNPFELKAAGGPDNVWIDHVGRASDHPGAPDPFAAFIDSVTAKAPVVRPLAGGTACKASSPAGLGSCKHGKADGFLVSYDGGDAPALTFGWSPKAATAKPPLTVDGLAVGLTDPGHRWSSPWASAGRDGHYRVEIDGAVLDLQLPVPAPVPPVDPPPTTTTTPPGEVPGAGPAVAVPGTPGYTG